MNNNFIKVFSMLIAFLMLVGFASAACEVTVTSPTVGAIWKGTNSITWTNNGECGSNVIQTIEYYDAAIPTTIYNAGTLDVSVGTYSFDTTTVSDSALAKVRLIPNGGTYDESGVFTVDNTIPLIAINDDADASWTNNDTISVTVSDLTSGIKETKWIVGSTNTCDTTKDTLLDVGATGNSMNADDDSIYLNKYICFRTEDNAGNQNYAVSSQILKLDTTAPTFVVSPDASTSWSTSDTIVATMSDSASLVSSNAYDFVTDSADCDVAHMGSASAYISGANLNVNSDHNDYICFSSTDNAGNTGYQASLQLHVDQSVPTLSFTDNVENGWVDEEHINADGNFNISGRQSFHRLYIADVAVCSGSSAWGSSTPIASDTIGLSIYSLDKNDKDICFRLIDNAGNTNYYTTANKIQVDPNAPTISITDNAGVSWTNSETISATMADTESGVNATSVIYGYVDTAAECDATGMASGTFAYTSASTLTLNSADHNDYICFYAEDNVGRETYQATLQLHLDVTNPTLTFTDDVEDEWVTQEDVTVDSDFDISGKKTFDYVFVAEASACDSGSGWAGTNINDGDTVSLTNNAQNGDDFCFRLIDNAGNTIYQRTSYMIQIDTTAPTITITNDATGTGIWVTADTIAATFADVPLESDVATMAWKFLPSAGACNAGNMASGTTTITTSPWLSVVGTSHIDYICLEAIDNVTNAAYLSTIQLQVDTTNPNVDAGADLYSNALFTQDATTDDVDATLAQTLSGIVTWSWTQQSGPGTITFGTAAIEDTTVSADTDGNYTIKLLVTDKVGNINSDTFVLAWDTTLPVTSGVEVSPTPVRAGSQFVVTAVVTETNFDDATADIYDESNVLVASLTEIARTSNDVVAFDFVDSDFMAGTFVPGSYRVVVAGFDLATNQEVEDDNNRETFEVIQPEEGDPIITSFTLSKTSGVTPGETITANCSATFTNNGHYEINGLYSSTGVMDIIADLTDGPHSVTCKAIDNVNERSVFAVDKVYTVGAVQTATAADLITYYKGTIAMTVQSALDWLYANTIKTIAAGDGLSSTGTNDPTLSVNVDDVTLEISTDALRVKDGGITTAKLNANAVTSSKILDNTITSSDIGSNAVDSDELSSSAIVFGDIQSVDLPTDGYDGTYYTETESNTNFVSRNNWADLDDYPISCAMGKYVGAIGDTLSCIDDVDTTYTAGSGLSLSGTVFSHTDTSSQSSLNNVGRTYIQDVSLDSYGHVTGLTTATETVIDTTLSQEEVEDYVGAMTSGVETHISVSYNDATGNIDYVVSDETDPVFSAWNKSTGINITESQIYDLDKYTQSEVDALNNNISGIRETDSGVKIHLTKGWTEFRLPAHVLTGTKVNNYSGLNLSYNYNVTNVLASIDGNYSYIAYYNVQDAEWKVWQDNLTTNKFTEFPHGEHDPNYVFSIHMKNTDTLVIEEQ